MSHIATLLEIQKQARECKKVNDLAFVVVNKIHKLVQLEQCVFWVYDNGEVNLLSISGGQEIDPQAPYALWLSERIKNEIETSVISGTIKVDLSSDKNSDWQRKNASIVPFITIDNEFLGGVWIDHNNELSEIDKDILSELSEYIAHCLNLLNLRRQSNLLSMMSKSKMMRWIVFGMIFLMLIPVRLSMTAPAEIVAKDPFIVTAPFDGIVEKIYMSPGQVVNVGDDLAIMDQTSLKLQYDSANQALRTAKSALSQAGLQSLRTSDKKTDLQALRLDIKTKKIELDHINHQIKKSKIQSLQSGVAIFSDVNEFKGKPIRTGEKIMMIANPKERELLIRVPSQALLPVSVDAEVSFFVNTSPFTSYSAKITSIGYQASQDEDGLLTYKIRAKTDDKDSFRIGWKGTAKIKTEWSILGYSLLRRPIIAIRNLLEV